MFKLTSKILAAAALLAIAGLVTVASASAWSEPYGVVGTIGEFDQPQLAHHCYGNQLTISVMNPDVGARANPVIHNPDGSYTVGIGSGGDREWVWYQATLFKQTAAGWVQLRQGDWWEALTGPYNPNVLTTYSWFNYTKQKWDYDLTVTDGLGYSYRQSGGLTMFSNLQIGPQYALVMDYRWGTRYDTNGNLVYGAARALSWQGNISC